MTNTIELQQLLVEDQYSINPYPNSPVEEDLTDTKILYSHSLINAFYMRNRKVVDVSNKLILDIGCGTGLKTMALALANPTAKVLAVDISKQSLDVAMQRMEHHKVKNVDFVHASSNQVAVMGEKFDYINCDDTLYLSANITDQLATLRSVLNRNGIIRANLHSALQRRPFYSCQEVFRMMGLFDNNPGDNEIASVTAFMAGLSDEVKNKVLTWSPGQAEDKFYFLMNYLLQSDRGYETPDMFKFIKNAELEFISMVDWAEWDVVGLFDNYDSLPEGITKFIDNLTAEQGFRIYELLNPIHRLLDFWCGHKGETKPFKSIDNWTKDDWRGATVYLQPQIATAELKEKIQQCAACGKPFEITLPFAIPQKPLYVDSTTAAWLLPLWQGPQHFASMLTHWRKLKPIDPINFLPLDVTIAENFVVQTLAGLENLSYVLIEEGLLQL